VAAQLKENCKMEKQVDRLVEKVWGMLQQLQLSKYAR
jgi:hypothetical protein